MAFLKRRTADPIGKLEAEIEVMRTRRGALAGQLATAESNLAAMIADRRRHLVEEDTDAAAAHHPRDAVASLRDHVDAITDALATLDSKIIEAEAKLVAMRDQAERDAAAKELTAMADALLAAVEKFSAASVELGEQAAPLVPRVPYCPPDIAGRLAVWTRDVSLAATELSQMARTHAAQVAAGEASIRAPAPPPPLPPALPIPRKPVFLLVAGKWQDTDGEQSAARHRVVHLPVAVADRAVQLGLAITETNGERARKLAELDSPDYARLSPDVCTDLTTGERLPPAESIVPPTPHTTRGMTGTARAVAR
jgi:hypothetical protein